MVLKSNLSEIISLIKKQFSRLPSFDNKPLEEKLSELLALCDVFGKKTLVGDFKTLQKMEREFNAAIKETLEKMSPSLRLIKDPDTKKKIEKFRLEVLALLQQEEINYSPY